MQNNPVLVGLSLIHQIRNTVDNPLVQRKAKECVDRLAKLLICFIEKSPRDKML